MPAFTADVPCPSNTRIINRTTIKAEPAYNNTWGAEIDSEAAIAEATP